MPPRKRSITTPVGRVSALIDPGKSDDLIVLGHGAGAPMKSDYMEFFASELAKQDLNVCRFNFPYMEQGRKSPDRQPILEECFSAIVAEVGAELEASKVILGGKSLGGRIASHVVAAGTPADALVFLGYPLHAPGRPDRVRDAHLKSIKVPMLFVEGTRDPFCPLDTLERVRKKLSARTEVAVIEDGDHSLKVRASSGRDTRSAWAEAVEAIARWVKELR